MATRIKVVEVMAQGAGMNLLTVERTLRVTGREGLTPSGEAGRRTSHFSARDLAHVILALGATQPAEAADAVKSLRNAVCRTNALTNSGLSDPGLRVAPGMTLLNWLQATIERGVEPGEVERLVEMGGGKGSYGTLYFTLSAQLSEATILVPLRNNTTRSWFETFSLSAKPGHRLRRTVSVQFDANVLIAAIHLWADTLAHQPNLIPDPVPGRAGEGEADPETTKAAGPGSHNGLLSKQPALGQTASSNKAQPIAQEGRGQLPPPAVRRESQDRCLSIHPPNRSDHHGAHWTHAASP